MPTKRAETVGERIRRLRGERGLSQRELAEPGLSYAYLSRLEAGQRLIEAGLLVGLVGALGLAASGRSRGMAAIAGLLLAVGLGLVLVVVHFGVSPFRHR